MRERPRAGRRHSTLGAAIEGSYQLLDDPGRRVFTRLGVFPADFDLSAAQEVAAAPDGATTALAVRDLVAKSLLVHEPSRGRYRYLETIRLFAREGLEASGELDATTERLRRHVVDRAAGVPRHRRWLSSAGAADSRADIENVRLAFHASLRRGDLTGAVDVALGLSTLWRNAMSFAEGLEWVTALRAARGLSDEDRMWVALLRADLGLGSGRHRIMGEAAAEARELAERLGHPQARLIAAMHQSLLDPDRPRAAETFRVLAGQAREPEEPQLKRLLLAFRLVSLLSPGAAPACRRRWTPWSGRPTPATTTTGTSASGWPGWPRSSPGTGPGCAPSWTPRWRTCGRPYAAAWAGEVERAAELVGACQDLLARDTAGNVTMVLVRDHVIRPLLPPGGFAAALDRGAGLPLPDLLAAHGV